MASRTERSALANWWWTVDRWMLAAVATLIVLGLVLTMAGSPPVAERLGLPTFHFVDRQALALIPTIIVLLLTSFLSPRQGLVDGAWQVAADLGDLVLDVIQRAVDVD